MKKHVMRLLGAGVVCALALTAAAQEPAGTIVGTYTLPDLAIADVQNEVLPESVTNDRAILLGGVGSDMWRSADDAENEFWLITDRGPNGQIRVDDANRRTFPIPEFTPLILHVQVADDTITILQTIPLTNMDGAPVTGLSNLEDHDERPWNYSAEEELTFNPDGLDTEGLVRTADGAFWLSEEYSPSLVNLNSDGQVIARYVPEGLDYSGATYDVIDNLPAVLASRRGNRGFEAAALHETTLFAAVQSPLRNPDADTGDNSRSARILAFDISTGEVTGEYVYQFEEATVFGADNVPGEMKISAMIALDADTLLVLERTDAIAHIYRVELADATNIYGTAWDDAATAPSLEALADPSEASVNVVPKTLIINLDTLEGMPDKIEGMALVDMDTIAVINDNDFGFGDFDAEGNFAHNDVKTQILIIDLAAPLQ